MSGKKMGTFTGSQQSETNVAGQTDTQLLSIALSGNRAALDDLVRRYERPIYRLAFRFFHDEDDARDATQEVFLKMYRSMDKFEGKSSFKTWLYRIASNTCISMLDAKKRQKKSVLQGIIDWFSKPAPEEPPDLMIESEYQSELKKSLELKLACLPEKYRLPVILRDVEGYSLQEIAAMTDLKLGTVKSRINRGRRMLQEALAPLYHERGKS